MRWRGVLSLSFRVLGWGLSWVMRAGVSRFPRGQKLVVDRFNNVILRTRAAGAVARTHALPIVPGESVRVGVDCVRVRATRSRAGAAKPVVGAHDQPAVVQLEPLRQASPHACPASLEERLCQVLRSTPCPFKTADSDVRLLDTKVW
jgi:hypothetical protein